MTPLHTAELRIAIVALQTDPKIEYMLGAPVPLMHPIRRGDVIQVPLSWWHAIPGMKRRAWMKVSSDRRESR